MNTFWRDLRYGARMLGKHKGFTLVAVLSLALGIGANTALFSLMDAVLLRMLPVQDPERLTLFEWRAGEKYRGGGMRGTFMPTEPGTRGASIFRLETINRLRAEQAQATDSPLETLFAYAPLYELTTTFRQQAETVSGQGVSGNYYAGLGVTAMAGRVIGEDDDRVDAQPVAVLSHHYWQKSMGGDLSVIGQPLMINRKQFTIIGVTPPGFVGSLQVDHRADVTVALAMEKQLLGERSAAASADRPELWWAFMMGRLKPGATREQARESLNGVFRALALEAMPPPRRETDVARENLPAEQHPRLIARAGGQGPMEIRTMTARTIYGLLAVVVAVLLLACANVANLLLARAAMRDAEISLRLAMGAGRWRIIRQLLTESMLLSLLGGATGVLFALWGQSALVALSSRAVDFLPVGLELRTDLRVLAFTLVVSLLTSLLFGLIPAWRATRVDLHGALKQGARGTAAMSGLSKGLIMAQVAISLVLLTGAGLFLRTVRNLEHVNAGFNQENLLLFELRPDQNGYAGEKLAQFYQRLLARMDALPGVRAATFGTVPLLAQNTWNTVILLPGESERSGAEHLANRQMMRENYFATMEIPLLRGRIFTAADDSHALPVGIVNQTFSRKFFPHGDALGQRMTDTDNKRIIEIVGVVGDTRYSSQREEIAPLLFTPWGQELDNLGNAHFAVRTAGEPTALAGAIRQIVRETDSNLPLMEFKTQVALAHEILGQERLYARLLSFFGVLALALAAVGLSGVLSYSVSRRTREIGIRMALGARAGNVLRLVIGQGLRLVLAGAALALLSGYGLKRLWQSELNNKRSWQKELADMLYGVEAADPLTISLALVLLAAVALLACWIPARRAARVDPMMALRCE
ncbi:MAG: ABC transporter permease [Blastocatellia bacterium]